MARISIFVKRSLSPFGVRWGLTFILWTSRWQRQTILIIFISWGFLIKECKFRLGSYQYRAGKMRFSLQELVKDVNRQNVLLEYLRLQKLQVGFAMHWKNSIKCQNQSIYEELYTGSWWYFQLERNWKLFCVWISCGFKAPELQVYFQQLHSLRPVCPGVLG